jgi:hypothetical protein
MRMLWRAGAQAARRTFGGAAGHGPRSSAEASIKGIEFPERDFTDRAVGAVLCTTTWFLVFHGVWSHFDLMMVRMMMI